MPSVLANGNVDANTRSPTRSQVKVSADWIIAFGDGSSSDFGWTESLDGGATWGAFTPIRGAGAGGGWFDIYYERWNSASAPNVIHIVYAYNSDPNRGFYYNHIDLSSGTAVMGTADYAVSFTPQGSTSFALVVAANSRIRLDNAAGGYYSDDGLTWTSTGDAAVDGDASEGEALIGWADLSVGGDAVCWLYFDVSAGQISLKRGNASGGGIAETSIGTFAASQAIDFQWASGIRKSNGHIYFAALDAEDVATAKTLRTWDIYGATVTARTNVLTATTYVQCVTLAITPTGQVYVFYARDSLGASENGEIYYKISTDAMVTWGAETRYDDLDSDKVKISSDPSPVGGPQPMWQQSDELYIMAPGITPPDDEPQVQFRLMLSDGVDPDIPVLNITPENIGERGTVLIKVERGRESAVLGAPPRAGTANFVINNDQLPYELDEPTPGLAVRLNKRFEGTWYHLWTGNLQIPLHEMFTQPYRPEIQANALGRLAKLAGKKGSTELYKDITTGIAIGHLLDAVDFPSHLRDLDAGEVTLPYWWMNDEDAWSALWKIVNSEGITADLYEDGFGRLVFRSRSSRFVNTRSANIQNTITATPTDPWFDTEFKYFSGLPEIVNDAKHERFRRTDDTGPTVVWEDVPDFNYIVPPSSYIEVEAVAAEPFFDAIVPVAGVDFLYGFSAPVVTLERTSGQRTKIRFTTDASGTTLTALQLRATTTINNATYVEISRTDAAASIAAYGLKPWAGEMSKELGFVDMRDNLDAIVAWKKDPRGKVRFSYNATNGPVANAATAQRELADRVRLVNAYHDFDGELWLERFEHEVFAPAGPPDGDPVGSERTTWEASIIVVAPGSSGTGVGEDNPYDSIDNSVYVLPTTGIDDMGLMMRGKAGLSLFAINDF